MEVEKEVEKKEEKVEEEVVTLPGSSPTPHEPWQLVCRSRGPRSPPRQARWSVRSTGPAPNGTRCLVGHLLVWWVGGEVRERWQKGRKGRM